MKEFERPKNNLALAIVGAVFFWPTAIAGIIRAAKVNSKWNAGEYEEAIALSKGAKKFAMISIIIGSVIWVLYTILIIVEASTASHHYMYY